MSKIKFIRQPSNKDCGPTCLSIMANYFDNDVSVERLKEYSYTNLMGTSLEGMIVAGEKIGLKFEGFELDSIDELKEENLPCICNTINKDGFSHFVVIYKIIKNYVYYVDPAIGKIKEDKKEFQKKATNIVLLLTEETKKGRDDNSIKTRTFYIELIKSNITYIILIIILSLVINLINILGAIYFKVIIDMVIPAEIFKKLHLFSFSILILYTSVLFSHFIRNQLNLNFNIKINRDLMSKYYSKILNLNKRFFDTRKDGEIISRFRDIDYIRDAFSSVAITVIIDAFMIILGTFVLLVQNKEMFVIVIVFVIIYTLLLTLFRKPYTKFNRMEMESQATLSSYFIEGIRGINVLKSDNFENKYYNKTGVKINEYIDKLYKLNTLTNLQVSLKDFLSVTTTLGVVWLGAYKVIEGSLTLGELMLFSVLVTYYLQSINRVIEIQPLIQSALVSTKRIIDILDLDIEEKEKGKGFNFKNRILFDNVSFSYDLENNVLNNLDFSIEKNESVAIVGESGSGKSTIGKLLLRFYDIDKGRIKIDDTNIGEIQISALRRNIGYVDQNNYLFNNTFLENLKPVDRKVCEDEIIKVCRLLGMHDCIISLPKGYHSIIESGGANLSGGQIQRLALAKTLLKKPEVLILDEPTSQLDNANTREFLKIISNIEVTKIIITHNKELVEEIENVLFFTKGSLTIKGNHFELMKTNKAYFDFWEYKD